MATSLRKKFGKQITALRKERGWSQEEFADKCGFARSYMSRIERGGANPSIDAIEILATGLKVHASKLFDGDK